MTRLSEDARWDQFVDPRIETREGSLEGLANERRDLLRVFSQDKFEKMMKGERRAFPEEKRKMGLTGCEKSTRLRTERLQRRTFGTSMRSGEKRIPEQPRPGRRSLIECGPL